MATWDVEGALASVRRGAVSRARGGVNGSLGMRWKPALLMLSLILWQVRASAQTPVSSEEAPAATRPSDTLFADGNLTFRDPTRPALADRRIVKHFDFNEEPLGNFDPIPMAWRPHAAPGFPAYLTNTPEGAFDRAIGAVSGPPSFVLRLNGGSLAYHYAQPVDNKGLDIAVRPGSDYLVVAYVRTDSLANARTWMSAYLLDRQGNVIPGTEHRSPLIGGNGRLTDWQPITIALRGDDPEARYMGLSVWLAQSQVWDERPRPLHAIETQDIDAVAWYDDITVYRLPRVALRCPRPGHVFTSHEPVILETQVTDPDGLNLRATLYLESEDGTLPRQRPVAIQRPDRSPVSHTGSPGDRPVTTDGRTAASSGPPATPGEQPGMPSPAPRTRHLNRHDAEHLVGFQPHHFDDLPPGLYRAELLVETAQTTLLRRRLTFARLAETVTSPAESGRRFGVVLNAVSSEVYPGQADLLQHLHLEFVKLPVWYAQSAALGRQEALDALNLHMEAVASAHSIPIAMLADDPDFGRQADGAKVRSMLDIFSDDPQGWKPLIAGTWSRYAGLAHVWQIGRDGEPQFSQDPRVPEILAILQREMRQVMDEPHLALVESLPYQPQVIEDSHHAWWIPAAIPPDAIPGHLADIDTPRDRTWITVDPLPRDAYPRLQRLADLSRRLAEAAFTGAGAVFMEAPWDAEHAMLDTRLNPREDMIIFRTVADVLGGTTPVARTDIAGKARCLVFDRNGRAVLFVWDPYAPPEGRLHSLHFGERAEEVDLWGNRKPLASHGRRQSVRIGPVPKFIINTPTWLMEFRRNFRLDSTTVEASFDVRSYRIRFRNTYHEPITGTLRLVPPEDWDVRPNRMAFTLAEGETFSAPIDIRFPVNAEAGVTAILGEFAIDADQRFHIMTPAWFELGLEDIDLDTTIFRVDDRVVVRQRLTNRTPGPVSFQGSVVIPERPRLRRTFVSFRPGQSVAKDFVIDNADDLQGRKIRVSLRELRGDRLWNRILTVP